MMTCQGWGTSGFTILGECSLAWIGFVIIFFLCMVLKRQTNDGILSGTNFNVPGAFILGLGANVIITAITGSVRWSFLAGLAGVAVGGFIIGIFFNTSSDDGGTND